MQTIKVLDRCYRSTFDSEAALRTLPLQQLLVLAAACSVASGNVGSEEFPFSALRRGLTVTAASLGLPSTQTAASVSSLLDQAVALSQCGLIGMRDPAKGRLGVWRLLVPAEALKTTLVNTNALIAKALIGDQIRGA